VQKTSSDDSDDAMADDSEDEDFAYAPKVGTLTTASVQLSPSFSASETRGA
jgi:hypothetical protein